MQLARGARLRSGPYQRRLVGLGLCIALAGCRPATGPPPAPGRPGERPSERLAGSDLALSGTTSAPSGPWSMQAAGQRVRLRSLKARGVVLGPLGFTELELEFDALPASARGARLDFELPPNAALHRFAVESDGAWHDAELVTDAQPPASATTGATSALRGTPDYSVELAALGAKPHLLVSYAEPLPLAGYRLPLRGLPVLDALEVSVAVGRKAAARHFDLSLKGVAPEQDFTLGAVELGPPPRVAALRAGHFAVARIVPASMPSAELTFLVDSSRSEPVPLARLADTLAKVTEELARAAEPPLVSVVAFDQDIHPIVLRAKPPLDARELAPLRDLGRLGGTDPEYALSTLIAQGLPERHVVLVTDAVPTVRPTGNAFNVRRSDLARLDAVAVDAASLARLREHLGAHSSWDYPGTLIELESGPAAIATSLLEPTPMPTRVTLTGADWTSTGSARTNDEHAAARATVGRGLWVFAEYSGNAPLTLSIDGKTEPALSPSADPALAVLLASVVGQARLAEVALDPEAAADPALARVAAEYHLLPAGAVFRVATRSAPGVELLRVHGGLVLSAASNVAQGGEPKLLAHRTFGRAKRAEVPSARSSQPPSPPAVALCPKLAALSDGPRSNDRCPPLSVSFRDGRQRLLAEVAFAPDGSVLPEPPHLVELAQILDYRRELEVLEVRATTRAHAEAAIRFLESRGVAHGRLVADHPLDASVPARKPSAECPARGEPLVLEVRKMGLSDLHAHIQAHPPKAVPPAPLTRFEGVERLLGYDSSGARAPDEPDKALRESQRWCADEPENPLAHVALGDARTAVRDHLGAARAYGSLLDLDVPGAGLVSAAAARLELSAGATPEARRHGGTAAQEERIHDIAVETFRSEWQDHAAQPEGARGYAYAAYREGNLERAWGYLDEAAKYSSVAERIELPVFAHLFLRSARDPALIVESMSTLGCRFPMQGVVHGAVLSWEDTDSELEVSVTSEPKHFEYDSVLADHGGLARAKWLPLPLEDAAYPIHVSVRAVSKGPRGYVFGVLRVITYNGRGRLFFDEKPLVVTGKEPIEVYSEQILQVPQGGAP